MIHFLNLGNECMILSFKTFFLQIMRSDERKKYPSQEKCITETIRGMEWEMNLQVFPFL